MKDGQIDKNSLEQEADKQAHVCSVKKKLKGST